MIKKIIFIGGIFFASPAVVAQWYVGGSLHRSNLSEWGLATDQNQLATMADVVGKTMSLRDPVAVKPFAAQVQSCINVVAGDSKFGSQPVADIAVGCMFELGYLPNKGSSNAIVVPNGKKHQANIVSKKRPKDKTAKIATEKPIYLCTDAQGSKELSETKKNDDCKNMTIH